MAKIFLLIMIFLLSLSHVAFGDEYIISKSAFTKDSILSKNKLKKTKTGLRYIEKIDAIASQLSEKKLEQLWLKLEKIDTSQSKLAKHKDILDYLKAKIGLSVFYDQTIKITKSEPKENTVVKPKSIRPDGVTNQVLETTNADNISLGLGIYNLITSDMDFSKSELQKIGFTLIFDPVIYDEDDKRYLISKYDNFGFLITNITSGKSTVLPSVHRAFPGMNITSALGSDFFGGRNGKHQIEIELIAQNTHIYSNYFKEENISKFDVYVKGIGTGESRVVGFGETDDDCKTLFGDITYQLKQCGGIVANITAGAGDKTFTFQVQTDKPLDKDVSIEVLGGPSSSQIKGFPRSSVDKKDLTKNQYSYDFTYQIYENELSVGVYTGDAYIGLKKGNNSIKNWLKMPIKIVVSPGENESNIDFCKTVVGDTTIYLEPCSLELNHIKGTGNKNFHFTVKSSDGKTYRYLIQGNTQKINGGIDFIGLPKYSVQGGNTSGLTSGGVQEHEKYFVDELIDVGVYNTHVYITPQDENSLNMRELRLPIKLTVTESIGDINYCSREINGVTYRLEPCFIDESFVDGTGNKYFEFKIVPSKSDTSYGYGIPSTEGFPIHGIIGGGTGGALGVTTFDSLYFNDSVLDTGFYSGYVPISINNASGTKQELRLGINVNVK